MNIRQFVVLFVASMSVSLVILIVFFSLFFKNLDLRFDTRLPQAAPVLPDTTPAVGSGGGTRSQSEGFRADGLQHAQVHVPPEALPPKVGVGLNAADNQLSPVIEPTVAPSDGKNTSDIPPPAPIPDEPLSPVEQPSPSPRPVITHHPHRQVTEGAGTVVSNPSALPPPPLPEPPVPDNDDN